MSSSSLIVRNLFSITVPNSGKIESFPEGFQGLIIFSHVDKNTDSKEYLVLSSKDNAIKLKHHFRDIKAKVAEYPNIAKQIISQNQDSDFSTLKMPLGKLLVFNNFHVMKIKEAVKSKLDEIDRYLRFGLNVRINVKFFEATDRETQKVSRSGTVFIDFGEKEREKAAVIMYVLKKCKWPLELNDMDPNIKLVSKMSCFPKKVYVGEKKEKKIKKVTGEVDDDLVTGFDEGVINGPSSEKRSAQPRPKRNDKTSWADETVEEEDKKEKKREKVSGREEKEEKGERGEKGSERGRGRGGATRKKKEEKEEEEEE